MPIECLTREHGGWGDWVSGPRGATLTQITPQNWERQLFYLIHIDKHTETAKWGDRGISFKSKNKANPPKKELNEIKVSNLAGEELKVTVINMLNGLKRRINEYSENFNKDRKYQIEVIVELENTVTVKVAQLCLTLCDPKVYTVHEILQARILEWIDFPFSRGSSQPRDQTRVILHCRWILYQLSYQGSSGRLQWRCSKDFFFNEKKWGQLQLSLTQYQLE